MHAHAHAHPHTPCPFLPREPRRRLGLSPAHVRCHHCQAYSENSLVVTDKHTQNKELLMKHAQTLQRLTSKFTHEYSERVGMDAQTNTSAAAHLVLIRHTTHTQ